MTFLETPLYDVAGVILGVTLIPVSLFIISYLWKSNWKATVVGRMMVQKAAAVWALLAITSYVLIVGEPPLGGFLAITISLFVFVTYCFQLHTLRRIQKGTLYRRGERKTVPDAQKGA